MENYEVKQEFLRKSILQAGFDVQSFIAYMESIRSEDQNIDLNNWTMKDLQQAVDNFKRSRQNNFEATQVINLNASKLEQINFIMKSRISVLFTKPKQVTYSLQDYGLQKKIKQRKPQIQIKDEEVFGSFPCTPISKPFRLSSKKSVYKINCQKFQVVQNPGYLFGIGAYKDIWITLNTNFTEVVVKRKIQDFQFLKNLLRIKFPGMMVPPLKNFKKFYFSGKDQINEQVTKVMNFVNDITKNQILFQSLYLEKFLTETNYKRFQAHKARNQANVSQNIKSSIFQIQSVSGSFQVQVSNKIQDFLRHAKTLEENYQNCYTNVYKSLSKVKQHLSKASFQMNNVIASYEILEAYLNKIHSVLEGAELNQPIEKSKLETNSTLYTYINEFQKNLQTNFNQIQRFMQNYECKIVKKSHQILEQFSSSMKDVRQSRKKYLQSKIQKVLKSESESHTPVIKTSQKVQDDMSDSNLRLWQGYLNSNLVYSFYFMESAQKQIMNSLLQKFFKKLSAIQEDRQKIFSKIQQIPKSESYSRILSSYMKIDEVLSNEQKFEI